MAEPWLVRVYNDRLISFVTECTGPLELGRRDDRAGEELYRISRTPSGIARIAIAPVEELKISRRLAWLEETSDGRLLVRNLSTNVSIAIEGGSLIKPGAECATPLPAVLKCGSIVIRIQTAEKADVGHAIQSLDRPLEPPSVEPVAASGFKTLGIQAIAGLDVEEVIGWLRTMIGVLQSAAGDTGFFQRAAQAAVELLSLDRARVLGRDGADWKAVASFPISLDRLDPEDPPSRLVLNLVCEDKLTRWFDPFQLPEDCSSLARVSSVVATPILDPAGLVIAILYGERRLESLLARRPVTRLDAKLFEVLAVGLSTGLARLEQQRAALSVEARFEQFFTPELAQQLLSRPELLTGQDREITVLFCDIRGFSRISRKHGPTMTLRWTNDVLSTLSDCVQKQSGVLVDYIGDELMAMWGAPEDQPDHAERACLAALEMIESMASVNAQWQGPLGEATAVGIGINTGIARVGNTGSHRKFKYGPLGDTVNVGSRVQGASKYFKSNLLITQACRDRLGPRFQVRRLGKARVVNIADAIELFELCSAQCPEVSERDAAYEEALCAFEAREFRKAARILGRLVDTHPDDGPSIALLARAIAYVVEEPETFDPAFRLAGK
jgi:adenylate cyclase